MIFTSKNYSKNYSKESKHKNDMDTSSSWPTTLNNNYIGKFWQLNLG